LVRWLLSLKLSAEDFGVIKLSEKCFHEGILPCRRRESLLAETTFY
jgi:hypothetical protein